MPLTHFVRGKGTKLFTSSGESFLDAISSWWTNLHGHSHPYIASSIAKQAATLEHVLMTDFTHDPALKYTPRLLSLVPQNLTRVFYSDNGSTAIETALKIAIQYAHNVGEKRSKILSLKNGYHGDTFGAMSLAGKNCFNLPFAPYFFEVIQIDPHAENVFEKMERAMQEEPLCFIYEPLIQGAFGMKTYSHTLLEELLLIAKKKNVILIADEVLTGFGRCGPPFVSTTLDTPPDMMALSKGITGGFLPLGATLCAEEIYATFKGKPFLHGHSYCGNPLGLAAAGASLDLLLLPACTDARGHIHKRHNSFMEKWRGHPHLTRLETLGTFLILEYKERAPTKYFFHSHHLILRPLGNVTYVLPPYCITDEELDQIYATLEKTL